MLDSSDLLEYFHNNAKATAQTIINNSYSIDDLREKPGKIIQIMGTTGDGHTLTALCEDGSLWVKIGAGRSCLFENEWRAILTPAQTWTRRHHDKV
jgi:hypothetical protein